jgi:hypothetical protein
LRKLFKWEKGWKRKKKREFFFPGLGTRFLAHPGRERARGSAYGPAVAQERGGGTALHARVMASLRAHFPARAGGGGETASRPDGVANRPSEGEGPVAGELDGGLPPVARFLVRGRVVQHGRRLAILRVGSIRPERVGMGLPMGRGRSSAVGIAAGGLWVGDGGWKVVLRVRGLVRELLGSFISRWTNGEGEGGGGKDSLERRSTMELRELCSGKGRRGMAEAGARKKELGASLL